MKVSLKENKVETWLSGCNLVDVTLTVGGAPKCKQVQDFVHDLMENLEKVFLLSCVVQSVLYCMTVTLPN